MRHRVLAAVIAATTLVLTAGDLADALAGHLDDRCCRGGVCCCRPEAASAGPCVRAVCPCGGHDGTSAHAVPEHATVPPAAFRLLADTTVGRTSLATGQAPSAGHHPPPYHPPRSIRSLVA